VNEQHRREGASDERAPGGADALASPTRRDAGDDEPRLVDRMKEGVLGRFRE